MNKFGVSFSIKQCRNFNISPSDCLNWLINDCGFKRYRLMSYWDEIEKEQGHLDFEELDKQIKLISSNGGEISLCLGARQPRWPENHWPNWALELTYEKRTKALFSFITKVVKRYRSNPNIVSYQLENEALLKNFGFNSEVSRERLREEFKKIKYLDPSKPIIMTTSTSWGMTIRRPIGNIVGFSYYQVVYNTKRKIYTSTINRPWLFKLRAFLINLILRRKSFIHELQLEPWGPKNIWEMSNKEQMKSMNPKQIEKNLIDAVKTNLYPIDLWGAEWWYWCFLNKNKRIINTVLKTINKLN